MEGEAQKSFDKASKNMLEFHPNTLAFEKGMQALMGECKKGLIKKYGDHSGKKSLMEWIEACHTSNEESRVVITMKVQAVDAGIKLCNLVIDFVFMMSRQADLAEKIWKFKYKLQWVTEDGNFNSMVIDKVLAVLEMAERELSEMKRSKELKNKAKAVIDDGNQEERLNVTIRLNERRQDRFFEEIMYQIFDQFLEAVLRLESVISHLNLPADSQMLMKEALSMMECGLKKCEKVLELIRAEIISLRKMFPLKFEVEDAKTTETRNSVASKMDELWRGVVNQPSPKDEDDSFMHRIKAKYARETHMQGYLGDDEIDRDEDTDEDNEGDVHQVGSSGVARLEIEQGQPSLNEDGGLQESREMEVEVEKEAKKPSNCCCCCCQ
uniref:Birch protein n=1 Tax=Betula platyphylla TaxID=78630 RepID=A0A9E9L698_BETPL|nr:birch protein [Betula platyphylla]